MSYYIKDLELLPPFYETSEECIYDINRFRNHLHNIERMILSNRSLDIKIDLIVTYEYIEQNHLKHAMDSLQMINRLRHYKSSRM